jgi:hypothetical protein
MSQAVLWWGYPAMEKPATDKSAIRDLKAKRNLLFNQGHAIRVPSTTFTHVEPKDQLILEKWVEELCH